MCLERRSYERPRILKNYTLIREKNNKAWTKKDSSRAKRNSLCNNLVAKVQN